MTVDMESDIRKLKLELLKEQLDDKLITFKAYLEKKQMNQTSTTAIMETKAEEKPFSTILFVPVVGDFEVWHFVIVIFMIWIFISK
jgi:hypothetical protein